MTWLDYAVLGVMTVSIAWGIWRGLVREVISLTGWVIAFLLANLLAGPLGELLPESISQPELRVLLAFVGIFVLVLALGTLAGLLLSRILKAAGLGGLDRTLGALFGIARGALIVVALGLVAGLTPLPRQPVWKQSASGPFFGNLCLALKPWLPPAFGERLRYH